MNKTTVALTDEQYRNLIDAIRSGFIGCRPSDRAATCLMLEANLGLRISDILNLRLDDIIADGDRFRLDIVEQKTGKKRTFTVPIQIRSYLQNYCRRYGIRPEDRIFDISERQVQHKLQQAADYLGYNRIGTHSFRKFFATRIYVNNNYNIVLVQKLLQHSDSTITQRYIGLGSEELENALKNNLEII